MLGCPGHLWVRHQALYLERATASVCSSIHGSGSWAGMALSTAFYIWDTHSQ